MSRANLVTYGCDRCDHKHFRADPDMSLPSTGLPNGWRVVEGRDLCPKCSEEHTAWWRNDQLEHARAIDNPMAHTRSAP